MTVPRLVLVVGVVVLVGVAAWYAATSNGEGADIRRRLQALSADVNQGTTDGRAPQERAMHLASYFTDDVDVDLGRGAAPIKGRETLIGIAERLQPRTSAFSLRFVDMTVAMAPGGETADVHLTAEIIRRSITTGEQSLDAREFTIGMRRVGGEWMISRVTAVDTLK